jgi:hypothetical protein
MIITFLNQTIGRSYVVYLMYFKGEDASEKYVTFAIEYRSHTTHVHENEAMILLTKSRSANNYFTWKDICPARLKLVGHYQFFSDNGQSKIFLYIFLN